MSKRKTPLNKETQEVVNLLTSMEVQKDEIGDITKDTSIIQQANAKRMLEDQNKVKNSINEILEGTEDPTIETVENIVES